MKALKHFLNRKAPSWAPELADIDYQSFYYYASPTKQAAKLLGPASRSTSRTPTTSWA